MDITFSSLKELYERLLPALRTKKNEMVRQGYTYIKEEDIWNYFKEKKWTKAKNLTLFDMVDDILNTDVILIDHYFKKSLQTLERHKNLEGDNFYE